MKCKGRFIKIFALLILGYAAFSLSFKEGIDSAVTYPELYRNGLSCYPSLPPAMPSDMFRLSEFNRPTSELLAYLFQLLFILFIISPPLIVILLFLIWKELKARNKMK
jgi:hypothetical protein